MKASLAAVLRPDALVAAPGPVIVVPCLLCGGPPCEHDQCPICTPCDLCAHAAIKCGRATPLAVRLLEKENHIQDVHRRRRYLRRVLPWKYPAPTRGPQPAMQIAERAA